ncbi:MAG: hypothetical protein ABMA64_01185 [Myxococcota bacterium]
MNPPEGARADSWRLVGKVLYGGRQVAWESDLVGAPPWEVALPAAGSVEPALFDGWQRDWLSRVRITLVALTDGRATDDYPVEAAWVVWPDGWTAVWLDEAARRIDAPNGAWSLAEQAKVAPEVSGDPTASVEPPTGGAL